MTAVKSAKKKAARKTTRAKAPAKVGAAVLTKKKASRKVAAKPAAKPASKPPAAGRGKAKTPAKRGLAEIVSAALEDMKGLNITVLDVRGVTSVADTIVIASGTSDRHVKSLATRVQERAREIGQRPLGVEGDREGEWVLVDLGDVIVHVMLPRVREFYALEKLWDVRSSERGPAT
jgi:ribosome-associated protein